MFYLLQHFQHSIISAVPTTIPFNHNFLWHQYPWQSVDLVLSTLTYFIKQSQHHVTPALPHLSIALTIPTSNYIYNPDNLCRILMLHFLLQSQLSIVQAPQWLVALTLKTINHFKNPTHQSLWEFLYSLASAILHIHCFGNSKIHLVQHSHYSLASTTPKFHCTDIPNNRGLRQSRQSSASTITAISLFCHSNNPCFYSPNNQLLWQSQHSFPLVITTIPVSTPLASHGIPTYDYLLLSPFQQSIASEVSATCCSSYLDTLSW